jgi:hypothetical protein
LIKDDMKYKEERKQTLTMQIREYEKKLKNKKEL